MIYLTLLAFWLSNPQVEIALTAPAVYRSLFWPEPTKEMLRIVHEDLGDDSFLIREAGSEKLAKMGWKAVTALQRGTRSKDPEIRHRCRRLLDLQLRFHRDNYPSVFRFNNMVLETQDGTKVTLTPALLKRTYQRRWEAYRREELQNQGWVHDEKLYNYEVGRLAAHDLMQGLILMGVDKEAIGKTCDKAVKAPLVLPKSLQEFESRGLNRAAPINGMIRNIFPALVPRNQ